MIESVGFISGKAGCVEHSWISNAIFSYAMKKKKDLFIASFDLIDAFESAQNLIKRNLMNLVFPKNAIKGVMESSRDAFINIQTNNEFMDGIRIGKWIKQGCPLNPILFNIGIDLF
jgi:hypothetical protein